MNKNFVIFKNPYLRCRKEEFGGIVKIKLKTFVLNKKQYEFITKMKDITTYNDLDITNKKLVKNLIEHKILLKVDLEKAIERGFNIKNKIQY